ncbi:MAG: ComF family protein [Candidatus Omnitrophica bacterium]|nr:ComF family protein [Candidatus Omnitrophota bacterium]
MALISPIYSFVRVAAGVLYPTHCVLCDEWLSLEPTLPLCPGCHRKLPLALPAASAEGLLPAGTAAFRIPSPLRYLGTAKKLIWKFKINHDPRAEKVLFHLMRDHLDLILPQLGCFDGVACAPTHRASGWLPDEGPSARIRDGLARFLGCPAVNLLKRIRTVPKQTSLSRAQRLTAASQSIASSPVPLRARILVTDDVTTTGATAAECHRALMAAGARETVFFSLAEGSGS